MRALGSNVRSRVAELRQPRPAARIARALWIAWAVIVWNVVFDRVIVVAGRGYIAAANAAGAPRANMDDFMRPAVTRGLWIASAAGGAVLVTGLAAVRAAESQTGVRPRSRSPSDPHPDARQTPGR